ncbi:MAG: hypothetical protein IKY83_05640 [Proteobacteria bacterium]|nr:hypothetical protein [Pseudomonadota bacterium]
MKSSKHIALTALAAMAAFTACADGDAIDNTVPQARECVQDGDCESPKVCRRNTCVVVNMGPIFPDDPTDPTDPTDPIDPSQKPVNPIDPALLDVDSDGDTISDAYDKCDVDTDNDTLPDCKDLDSDGDTIPDALEGRVSSSLVPADSDMDFVYDFLDTDSDDNGIPDSSEVGPDPTAPTDFDGDTVPDYLDDDDDDDGAIDIVEISGMYALPGTDAQHPGRKCGSVWCQPGTAHAPWDSDSDTIPDYLDSDSDNDTLPDFLEGDADSDGDGILDRYDEDSDNDGTPDKDEIGPDGSPITFTDASGNVNYCFKSSDCDGDALPDKYEVTCDGSVASLNPDVDNDGYPDGAEYVAAQYAIKNGLLNGQKIIGVSDLLCNPNLGVKDVFEFYFELPYGGESKKDNLRFTPSIKKLDLVFNVDTTGSMEAAINNIKTNIGNIILRVRNMVQNSGFALTNFDDFPIADCKLADKYMINGTGPYTVYAQCGVAFYKDLPFRVLGTISTDDDTVTNYTRNKLFTIRHGGDGPESGAESLYQIATGKGVSWKAGSIENQWFAQDDGGMLKQSIAWGAGSVPPRVNAPNTWGGVDFRLDALPIVIHTTDVYSHDKADNTYIPWFYPDNFTYTSTVINPHYTADLIPELKSKGIRVITLSAPSYDGGYHADELKQMTIWSRESNAVVPACAFDNACGTNKCCLGTLALDPVLIDGEPKCVLTYRTAMSDVSSTLVKGVDALVKYGTYEVATRIRGERIEGTKVSTSCFIKQVVATTYVAPPYEPEKSCNPVATPTSVGSIGYNNGFKNFAPGTSDVSRPGAELHFTVIAQNDNCVAPKNEAQLFTAYIDVYDPTTGVSFGERKVSIIVPIGGAIVN